MESVVREKDSVKDSLLRIASCSYEGSLFGWNIVQSEEDEGLDAKMCFGFNCSPGSLKSVAVSTNGKYLACGGMEERIKVFNIAENKSMGELSMHSGAITCLQFFEDSYLLSGSEDSTLCIWRCHDWSCVHVLAGHKGAVNSVSVHPSGKLALSVSKDNTMKMWNLVHGRCAFTRRLRGPADKVLWHPSGELYMLVVGSEVQLYQASDNACLATIKHKMRVNQAVYTLCGALQKKENATEEEAMALDKNHLRVAAICEDKMLYFYDLEGKETAKVNLEPLEGRPRDMWSCPLVDLSAAPTATSVDGPKVSEDIREVLAEEGDTLTVVTSTGRVAVLSSRAIEQGVAAFEEASLCSTEVRAEPRLTAVVSWRHNANPSESKKRRRTKEEEGEDDDDSDLDSDSDDDSGDDDKSDDGHDDDDDGKQRGKGAGVAKKNNSDSKKPGKPSEKSSKKNDVAASNPSKKQKTSSAGGAKHGDDDQRRKSVSFSPPPAGGGGSAASKSGSFGSPKGAGKGKKSPNNKFNNDRGKQQQKQQKQQKPNNNGPKGQFGNKGGNSFSKGGHSQNKGGGKNFGNNKGGNNNNKKGKRF